MHPALWVSVTGLEAKNNDIRVISNNLANVSTAGFKTDRAIFEDLLYQTVRQAGAQSSSTTELPSGLNLGTGVRTVATQKDFSMGALVSTDNQLDIAINGQGFFQVLRPDGQVVYSRDGRFEVNSTGQVVTANGYLLQPAITIPGQTVNVTIGADGTVEALIGTNVAPSNIGNITISNFINPAGLQPLGENQYAETAASGAPVTGAPGQNASGLLLQHAYEASNVNVVEELVRLIETQRGYEMNAKSIETVDGMLRYVTQTL